MSTSVSKKNTLNKTQIIKVSVDKDEDSQHQKEFLHKIDI